MLPDSINSICNQLSLFWNETWRVQRLEYMTWIREKKYVNHLCFLNWIFGWRWDRMQTFVLITSLIVDQTFRFHINIDCKMLSWTLSHSSCNGGWRDRRFCSLPKWALHMARNALYTHLLYYLERTILSHLTASLPKLCYISLLLCLNYIFLFSISNLSFEIH